MQTREIDKLNVSATSLLFGGLIIIDLVIFQNLISSATLDMPELIALICLSLALPVLAGGIFINFIGGELAPEGRTPILGIAMLGIACTVDIIGIAAAIWHASWAASLLFLATSTFSFVMYYRASLRMMRKAYASATNDRKG